MLSLVSPAPLPVSCVPVGVDVLPGVDVPLGVPAWGLVPLPFVFVVPDDESVCVSVETPVEVSVCVPDETPGVG